MTRIHNYFTLLSLTAASLLGSTLLSGCDGAIESAYKEQLVASAILIEGSPVDSVVLHRTTPFGSFYNDLEYAVDSAEVTITVDGASHRLLPASRKGRYYLPASELTITGGKTYELSVKAPNHQSGGFHMLHASTIVPLAIHYVPQVDSIRGRTVVLDTARLIDFQYLLAVTPSEENRRYLLGVRGLDTTIGKIQYNMQGPPVDTLAAERYSFVQSGPMIGVSPRLFAWFGPNLVTFYAIDTNWVDYRRQVFSPNASYQPSLNHIDGGMGVFGSASRDTLTIYIKPKE